MRARSLVLAVLVVLTAFAAGRVLPSSAAGQKIYVDANVGGGADNGNSWGNAFDTLQEGLADATAGDEVWVADGTYKPGLTRADSFQLADDVTVLGGFASGENNANQRDPSAHPAILSGDIGVAAVNTDNVHHVVRAPGVASSAELDGFTVTGGYADGLTTDGVGGGIYTTGAPTLRSLIVTGNAATGAATNQGGGIYAATGSPTIENTTIAGNSSQDSGGGLFVGAGALVTNTTVSGNSSSGNGGGISIAGGVVVIKNATFSGNAATTTGDALYLSAGTVTVQNSILYGNDAGTDDLERIGGTLTITNAIVQSGCPGGVTCPGVTNSNPSLGALQDNGGFTTTRALPVGSPAVDAGDNATCLATDQRDVARPQDGDGNGTATCDLGAFELFVPKVQFAAATGSGQENQSPNVAVQLDAASQTLVTVNYAVTGGTAIGGGADFTLAAGTLTFVPSDTSESIALAVVNDALDEADDTVILTLSSPGGAVLGAQSTHIYTILDNDPGPAVQFAAGSASGSESVTNVSIAVTLAAASGQTVTVDFAASGGSATAGLDYKLPVSPLSIPAGKTTGAIKVKVVDDFFVESDETFVLMLSNPSTGTLGGITSFTYAITNNDAGTCRGKAATIVGTGAANTIIGTAGDDIVAAGPGNDTIKAGGGNDTVCGGKGDDKAYGQAGNDKLYGEAGNDLLSGGGGADIIEGAGGKDTGRGGGGNDKVNGAAGVDTLDGGGGTDVVNGGAGNDTVKGGGGNKDVVKGQGGEDRLAGGLGTGDTCDGGLNKDSLLAGHGCEVKVSIP